MLLVMPELGLVAGRNSGSIPAAASRRALSSAGRDSTPTIFACPLAHSSRSHPPHRTLRHSPSLLPSGPSQPFPAPRAPAPSTPPSLAPHPSPAPRPRTFAPPTRLCVCYRTRKVELEPQSASWRGKVRARGSEADQGRSRGAGWRHPEQLEVGHHLAAHAVGQVPARLALVSPTPHASMPSSRQIASARGRWTVTHHHEPVEAEDIRARARGVGVKALGVHQDRRLRYSVGDQVGAHHRRLAWKRLRPSPDTSNRSTRPRR